MKYVFRVILALVLSSSSSIFSTSIQSYTIKGLEKDITLVIKQADITKDPVDAIVNAANPQLQAGGGVCGAIFSAAGLHQLQDACDIFPVLDAHATRCQVGQAVITDSFDLQSKGIRHIIHAVGPDCRVVTDENQQNILLKSAYVNSLIVANAYQVTSIAFPFISSAIYAFPKKRACDIAINSVIDYLRRHQTTLVLIEFVLFSHNDFELFIETIESSIHNPGVQDDTPVSMMQKLYVFLKNTYQRLF